MVIMSLAETKAQISGIVYPVEHFKNNLVYDSIGTAELICIGKPYLYCVQIQRAQFGSTLWLLIESCDFVVTV